MGRSPSQRLTVFSQGSISPSGAPYMSPEALPRPQWMRPSGVTTRRFEATFSTLAWPMPKCVTRRAEPSDCRNAAAVRCTARS